jgi:hypothetical protein
MIVNHDLTLRLRWGHDASREITVPVEYRKGSYSGRYELYIDNTHVGWVVKHDGQWHGYVTAEQSETGDVRQVALDSTRFEAVDTVIFKLGQNARVNVLAQRAEEAYA